MKRIPIIRSFWHPAGRVMKPHAGREVYHILSGVDLMAWSCRGVLTVPGLGQYLPS